MKKRFFFIFILFFLLIRGGECLAQTSGAERKAIKGLNEAAGVMYTGEKSGGSLDGKVIELPEAIGRAVGGVLAFVGTAFLILMVYGGIIWMLARGNEQQVAKAKAIIEAAVIGIIIVILAYAVTNYVGETLLPGTEEDAIFG